MYRLMIVDDEQVIADGLTEVFGRFDVELDICKAYSGFEALEMMKRYRVDVVLTDIRMPGMDGIQLMERIRSDWPHCKIIFLTGYDEFDYVYKAIQRPGVSYILKTEGYRRVKERVREAIEQLDHELLMNDIISQSNQQLTAIEGLLQGEYLRYVMKGARGIEELKLDFEKLRIELDPSKRVLVVLGALNLPRRKDSYVDRQEAALAVKRLSDAFLHPKVNHISVLDRYHDVLWLIQFTGEESSVNDSIRRLEGVFELIEQACTESLGIALAITLAKNTVEWRDLSTAYERLRQYQSVRVGDGAHMVQTVNMKETAELAPSAPAALRSAIERVDLLAIHLESGRREEFFELLERVVEAVNDETELSFAMECYYSIALVLLAHMNRLQGIDNVNVKSLMSFEDHVSWSEGYDSLKRTAEYIFAHRQTGEKNRAAQAVDQVRAYIEAHLDEDLSLMRLAERIYFNPSYLSRLFKQECKVNLSDYIEERRMKRAKELLKTHEFKIAEVGAKVGYAAPHSFTRFFKKLTGLTPQEYRDDMRKGG